MARPNIASRSPYAIEVEAGKSYFWCACGKSQKQPFCDGSHQGSAFVPKKFEAAVSEVKWFCGCKQTASAPFCDGSHQRLAPASGT
jgi:CDGSH-type Zn-finger protein